MVMSRWSVIPDGDAYHFLDKSIQNCVFFLNLSLKIMCCNGLSTVAILTVHIMYFDHINPM